MQSTWTCAHGFLSLSLLTNARARGRIVERSLSCCLLELSEAKPYLKYFWAPSSTFSGGEEDDDVDIDGERFLTVDD